MKTKEEAIEDLRGMFPKGSTVYSVFRHRSASNMAGWYSFVALLPKGGDGLPYLLRPNYAIAVATGRTMTEKGAYFCIRVNGCGYDRPASVVADLARELYGDETALRHESI